MFPKLYAIIDENSLAARAGTEPMLERVCHFARELAAGGVTLMQYRAKDLSAREMLMHARELRRILPPEVKLIMNDRADLCLAADFDGVHVGQDDLSPENVREIIRPKRLLGVSTHNVEQLRAAAQSSADYLAIGPVYGTVSKLNPDPIVGLEGVGAAREVIGPERPLVAIGGIGPEQAADVLRAGATSVAIIGALLDSPRESAAHFLNILM
jgi:thiamine-phosphate pyrophosphorylase